jgi:hypothetical protein
MHGDEHKKDATAHGWHGDDAPEYALVHFLVIALGLAPDSPFQYACSMRRRRPE